MSDNLAECWGVMVRTKRLGGGVPMSQLFYAAFADEDIAREAVLKHISALEGEEISQCVRLTKGTVEALKIAPGTVGYL